jgi:hypothetical protein
VGRGVRLGIGGEGRSACCGRPGAEEKCVAVVDVALVCGGVGVSGGGVPRDIQIR